MANHTGDRQIMEINIAVVIALSVVLWILSAVAMYYRYESWIIWTVYFAIVLTLLVPALAWQKRVWDRPSDPPPDRAYVVVSKGYLAEPPNTGNPPVATLEFENTGQTPAVNMRISVNYARLKDKAREEARRGVMPEIPQNPFESIAVLGSGKIAKFSTPKKEWDNPEIQKLWTEGRFVQYLWGEIYYNDIKGWKHITHFCVAGETPDSHRLGFCLHGNWIEDTDKEPPERSQAQQDGANPN